MVMAYGAESASVKKTPVCLSVSGQCSDWTYLQIAQRSLARLLASCSAGLVHGCSQDLVPAPVLMPRSDKPQHIDPLHSLHGSSSADDTSSQLIIDSMYHV